MSASKVEIGRNPLLVTDSQDGGVTHTLAVVSNSPPAADVRARSSFGAATKLSSQLAGLSTTQLAGLSQMIVSGGGATSAAAITIAITGLSTVQVGSAGAVNIILGVPAISVTADPVVLNVTFDPPLQQNAYGTPILVEVPSFGSGNLGASLFVSGKVVS